MDLSLIEQRLLRALGEHDGKDARDIAAAMELGSSGEVVRAAAGPERHGLVRIDEATSTTYALTEEGKRHQGLGLPERRAATAIMVAGGELPMGDLASKAELDGGEVKVAIGWLKRKGWADIAQGKLMLKDGQPKVGADEKLLNTITPEPAHVEGDALRDLVQRGAVQEHESTTRTVHLTDAGRKVLAELPEELGREVNQITPGLIAEWEEMDEDAKAKVQLRRFDFDVPVAARHPGKPHPLTQIMEDIRHIFWTMGFQEIQGDYVESAFWNMDALFIPQDHPAREMQDTFYLKEPASLDVADEDLERGQAVHEHGGDTGSTGWRSGFDPDVSKKALLRTHTTNTTVRYLAENPKGRHRVFGLGRVFRNETMDATHLPEFHQIEGIVTEEGATFDMLIGLCRHFFTKMGFPDVRFRPAYFPYTEPSMEIEVKMDGRWVELGGCGVFRPEVTEPLGVEHPVLAWGFGLERLALRATGLKDIRHLYIPDVQALKEQPLV